MTVASNVTVVVPTRNRRALLMETLQSVFRQTAVELQVVVVDDGSTDGTADALACLPDRRLKVLRHSVPGGVARARNAGIEAATGEWIAFLDDDDLWAPTKLQTQLEAVARERSSYAYSAVAVIDAHGHLLEVLSPVQPDRLLRGLLEYSAIPAGASNVVARATLVRDVGGFDERLSQLCDWDLWIRLAAVARGTACDDVHVAYRRHSENMIVTDCADLAQEVEYLASKHQALARSHGVELDRVRVGRWVAWGHRREGRRGHAARQYFATALGCRDAGSALRGLAALLGESRIPWRHPSPAGAEPPEWLTRHLTTARASAETS